MELDSSQLSDTPARIVSSAGSSYMENRDAQQLAINSGERGIFVETAITRQIGPVPTFQDAMNGLRFKVTSMLDTPGTVSNEHKLSALTQFSSAYFPSSANAWLAQKVIAMVRASLSLRDPSQPRYSKFIHGQRDVMAGGELKAMPAFLHSLQGAGVLLAGPTGTGKTAFIQRLRACIGEEHTLVRLGGAAPAEMRFLPVLYVRWPDCGTLLGLLGNMRNALISELGSADTDVRALSYFFGKRGQNIAIATCIFLNLGLFVIDGASIRSLRGEYREILNFVATLQEFSGIPTIVSCTYPVAQVVTRLGGRGANLSNFGAHYFDLVPPGNLWHLYCHFAWKLGQLDKSWDMPAHLPECVWNASLGNFRIATHGFIAIHQALINTPTLWASGTLSQDAIRGLLELNLRAFVEPLKVMHQFARDGAVPDADLWTHGDYLPFEAFSGTPSCDFENKRSHRRGA